MNYISIIQDPHEIYDRYQVPMHFRNHMLQVGNNAKQLAMAFLRCRMIPQGPKDNEKSDINEHLLQATGYVHDLANILKVTEENHTRYKGLEGDWRERRAKAKVYGPTPTKSTIGMQQELGIDRQIQTLTQYMDSQNFSTIANSMRPTYKEHLQIMILTYADATSSPFGPVSLETRRDEMIKRLGHCEKRNKEYQHLKTIETMITKHIDIPYNFLTFN